MVNGILIQAPKIRLKVNGKKVPMNAIIVTMLFAVACGYIKSIVAPGTVYLFLTSIIGISNIFILYITCGMFIHI